jgi:hypothetical protein
MHKLQNGSVKDDYCCAEFLYAKAKKIEVQVVVMEDSMKLAKEWEGPLGMVSFKRPMAANTKKMTQWLFGRKKRPI